MTFLFCLLRGNGVFVFESSLVSLLFERPRPPGFLVRAWRGPSGGDTRVVAVTGRASAPDSSARHRASPRRRFLLARLAWLYIVTVR